jgi:hypothetical protein
MSLLLNEVELFLARHACKLPFWLELSDDPPHHNNEVRVSALLRLEQARIGPNAEPIHHQATGLRISSNRVPSNECAIRPSVLAALSMKKQHHLLSQMDDEVAEAEARFGELLQPPSRLKRTELKECIEIG